MLIANATKKGRPPMSKVFFRPILSAKIPAANGPMAAASGRKDPTHPSCDWVSGSLRGFSSRLFNFGISGDVHPNEVPHMKDAMFPGRENMG